MTQTPEGGKPAIESSETSGALFERFAPADVRDLIADFPLAQVRAVDADLPPSLLPLLGDYDDSGRLTTLVGHMAARNPLVEALGRDGRASVLFRGPSGYVSPAHAGRRDWAPTWNYVQVDIDAVVEFTPEETDAAVRRLVDTMEAGRAAPWRVEELGERYRMMSTRIIGFRAHVSRIRGRFKLGQDEGPETLRRIIAAAPDPELARWMTRFNGDRL